MTQSNPNPVDSAGITQGAGVPDQDLDRLIAATIPVDDNDNFGLVLADVAQHARMAGEDIEDALEALPGEAPISLGLDLVNAQAHIRTALRLIAHAADALAVTR